MAAALAALLPLSLAVPASAAVPDAVDQSATMPWVPVSSMWGLSDMAQTFTAHVTGQVDRISLQADGDSSGFAGVNLYLEKLDLAGHPDGSPITGRAATTPSFGLLSRQWHDFYFSPMVPVTAGTHYAIVVSVWAGNFKWWDSGPVDVYAGGQQLIGLPWGPGAHRDFMFKEWVASNVSSGPTLTTKSSGVTVSEGSDATMTGTCAGSNPITLTASRGTVTPTCTAGGWSWNEVGPDETAATPVTITAVDGSGQQGHVQFTLVVNGVKPVATILTDPLQVPEDTTVPFTGGATSPAAADNSAGFSYSWTVKEGAAGYASGSGPAFSFVPKDVATYTVTFTATDDGGMAGTTSMTVQAINVAPNVAINSVTPTVQLVITPEESVVFKGSFTDADTASTDSYSAMWSFGDGGSATGTSATHAYTAAGTYNVTFTVGDGEGTSGRATATVKVQTAQQALASIEAYVQGLPGLSAGQKNSLLAKLSAASDSIDRGNNNAANNQLNAFLNELSADVNTGKVLPANATTLRDAVHAVQGALGTFNRFLEWWPLEA